MKEIWTNIYIRYPGVLCFSNGYATEKLALEGRKHKNKSTRYIGPPVRIDLPIDWDKINYDTETTSWRP